MNDDKNAIKEAIDEPQRRWDGQPHKRCRSDEDL
jgi:hypothetical protein